VSAAAAILVESQAEARAVEEGSTVELRPLPVWCPLPRDEDDPKLTCVGWVAGRQTAHPEGLVVTTTWCRVNGESPPELVSRPGAALGLERLPREAGALWPLSRPRSLGWLPKALATIRRFPTSLDLGAINERRAATFAGARWPGSLPALPVFGRGWWLPGEEQARQESATILGALGDRFVLLDACGGEVDELALVGAVEVAAARRWREERSRRVGG